MSHLSAKTSNEAIAAYIDTKGYIRCAACQANSDATVDFQVYADNSAFHDDACDVCHVSLKPAPIWVRRRDLYDRLVAAQNTCWAYGKPQEFDGALPYIETVAAFLAHVEFAERKAAVVSALRGRDTKPFKARS